MLFKKRQSRQPSGALKLRSALGFDSFLLPGVGVDLVTGAAPIISGTVDVPGAQCGRAFVNTNGSTLFLTSNANTLLSTSGATIVLAGRTLNPGTNVQVAYGVAGANPGGERCNVAFVGNNAYWDFGGTSGANRVNFSLAGITLRDTDIWVFSAGQRGIEIWLNGTLMVSGSTPVTRSASTSNFGMWGDPCIWYAAGYSRVQLPKEVCRALSLDLWGTAFVQRRRGLSGTVSAAAARRRVVLFG